METSTSESIEFTIKLILSKESRRTPSVDWPAICGLVFLFAPAFALNALLIGTVVSSYALRRSPFHLLLTSLASACLLDCVVNMTVSLAFVSRGRLWTLGRISCAYNAFTSNVVTGAFSVEIGHLLVDRVLAVRRVTQYKQKVTWIKQVVAIVIVWAVIVVFALPIGLRLVDTRPFPARYACGLAKDVDVYVAVLGVLVYAVPLTVSVVCAIFLLAVLRKDWKASHASVHAFTNNKILRQPLLWSELQLTRLALGVFLLYLLFLIPWIVNTLEDAGSRVHPFEEPRNSTKDNSINISSNSTGYGGNSTGNGTVAFRRDVLDSPPRDTAFTWLRYLEVLLFPVLVFYARRDIWEKALVLVTFWKRHPNVELSPRPTAYLTRNPTKAPSGRLLRRKKAAKAHYSTPVLFATSEGLYLRIIEETGRRTESGGLRFWLDAPANPWSAGQPEFVCHVCDVWDAFDDIEDLEEDEDDDDEDEGTQSGVVRDPSGHRSGASDVDSGIVGEVDEAYESEADEDAQRRPRSRKVRFAAGGYGDGSSTNANVPASLASGSGASLEVLPMPVFQQRNAKRRPRPGWNVSTRPSESWAVLPTGNQHFPPRKAARYLKRPNFAPVYDPD